MTTAQADRAARTRSALLESAAHGLARYGYGNLVLEQVARDAGYSRGALYHLFADKEELALAAVAWVTETWSDEVDRLIDRERDPLDKLLALARGHALYCRRDVARLRSTLRSELGGRDHPVGNAVQDAVDAIIERCAALIIAGRKAGSIPSGPPAEPLARAFVGALEGTVSELAGQQPYDERLAERAVRGVLGLAGR